MKKYVVLLMVGCAMLFPTLSARAAPWFDTGERLVFDVKWSFLSAGHAELLFMPQQKNNYRIVARAWTNNGVDTLFTMRDRIVIEGTRLADGTPVMQPETYHLTLNENDYRADKFVTFRPQFFEAIYKNRHANEPRKVVEMEKDSRDVLSSLYFLRTTADEVAPGVSFTLPVVELDRTATLQLNILERGTLRTIFGKKTPVLKVKPVITQTTDKKVKDRWTIWITDDATRTPVRIEVDLPVGSFQATLAASLPAESPSRAPEGLTASGTIDVVTHPAHANPFRWD